jgi:Zn-finger protein
MLTASHVLIAFAAAALWLLSLYAHPFGRCWRCHGKRVVIKRNGRRARKCRVCNGIGRRQRTGSRALHRTIRKIRRELDRQRRARQQALEEDPR